MSIKIDITVCRVCCVDRAMHSIMDHAKQFQYCTSLEVSEGEGMPTMICDPCLERLNLAYEFKMKCLHTDRELRTFLKDVKNRFRSTVSGSGTGVFIIKNTENEFDEQLQLLSYDKDEEKAIEPEDNTEKTQIEDIKEESTEVLVVHRQMKDTQDENQLVELVEFEFEARPPEDKASQSNPSDSECSTVADTENMCDEQIIYISIPNADDAHQSTSQGDDLTEKNDDTVKERDTQTLILVDDEDKTKMNLTPTISNKLNRGAFSLFPCEKCSKCFSTKTNLYRHLQSHDGHKPYMCHVCCKCFTQNGSLKQHMYIHENLRPYVCNVCQRGFTQPKSLTFHMRRHTGEKPFQCNFCALLFRQKDGLKRHILARHNDASRKQHICEICNKSLRSRYSLKLHLKRHESCALNRERSGI